MGVSRGQLANRPPGLVETVDAKPRRLLGDGAVAVLEAAARPWQCPGNFRSEEEGIGAVTDASDAERGVDCRPKDPALDVSAGAAGGPRKGEQRGRRGAALEELPPRGQSRSRHWLSLTRG